jgi:ATP-dependent RNA helicase SUPV3L1/SUV3
VARLVRGDGVLAPQVEPLPAELLEGPAREIVRKRLAGWLARHVERRLRPLLRLRRVPLAGAARGLAFQLVEALGCLPRRAAAEQLRALSEHDRRDLARLGIVLGAESLWLPALFKGDRPALAAQLRALADGLPPPTPPAGRPRLLDAGHGLAEPVLAAFGYRLVGGAAVRVDALEKLAIATRKLARQGPFAATAELGAAVGGDIEALTPLLAALGYRRVEDEAGALFVPRKAGASEGQRRKRAAGDSPFARLGALHPAK